MLSGMDSFYDVNKWLSYGEVRLSICKLSEVILVPPWRIRLLACSHSELLTKSESCRQLAGLLGWVTGLSQGRYLHRTTQTQNKCRQTSMSRVGFEPTLPLFQFAKEFHAFDTWATMIGVIRNYLTSLTQIYFWLLSVHITYNLGYMKLRYKFSYISQKWFRP
jgi:hypothetical protein